MKIKKHSTAAAAIMLSLCLVFGYIETIIPLNLGVPGAKIGICNLIILLILKRNGLTTALGINILRIVIINMLFVNVFSLCYALPAGIISTLSMYLILKLPSISGVGASALGGAMHNFVQSLVAAIVLGTPAVFTHFAPILLILGMAAGILCGLAAELIFDRLKKAGL